MRLFGVDNRRNGRRIVPGGMSAKHRIRVDISEFAGKRGGNRGLMLKSRWGDSADGNLWRWGIANGWCSLGRRAPPAFFVVDVEGRELYFH